MPVRKTFLGLALLMAALIGCTGQQPVAIPTVAVLPTVTPVTPTATPRALPPTWTPWPSPTPACDVVIASAAAAANRICAGAGIGEGCLVAAQARVSGRAGGPAVIFGAPGDRVTLAQVSSVDTLAYDPATSTYGMVVLKVQADPPGVAPGQWVTAVMVGDATVADTGRGTAAFQAMIVRTGDEDVQCGGAPLPSVLLQNTTGQDAELTVNGLDVRFTGTVLVRAQAGGQMRLVVLNGQAQGSIPDGSPLTAPGGGEIHASLGGTDGFEAQEPLALEPFDSGQLAYLPLVALPQAVAIGPAIQRTAVSQAGETPGGGWGGISLGPTDTPTPTPAVPFQGTPPNGIRTYTGRRITPGQTVTGSVPPNGSDRWVFEPVGVGPDSFDYFEVQALGGWDPVLTIESATWGVYEGDYDSSPGDVEVYAASLAGSGGDWRIVIRDSQGGGGGYILRYVCQGPCPD